MLQFRETGLFFFNFTCRSVFCLLGIAVTVATVHHTWINNDRDDSKKPMAIQLLHCFSAKRNCETLLAIQEDAKDSLSCVHGIRVLTICWIVLMHVGSEFTIERISYNKQTAVKVILPIKTQPINQRHSNFWIHSEFTTMGSTRPRQWFICS